MNIPQIFKTKCLVNFRKYKSRKKFRFGLVKSSPLLCDNFRKIPFPPDVTH